MKELKGLKLSSGDLIRLSTPEGQKGLAVAWLANQTNPGNKPIAKVSELLKEKYGISLNDRVFIEKADEDWRPVDTIEVTFQDSTGDIASAEDLLYWARYALGTLCFLFHVEPF